MLSIIFAWTNALNCPLMGFPLPKIGQKIFPLEAKVEVNFRNHAIVICQSSDSSDAEGPYSRQGVCTAAGCICARCGIGFFYNSCHAHVSWDQKKK